MTARRPSSLVLKVRVTPRADRDAVAGPVELSDGSRVLSVRVRAVPEDGKANAAVVALVAAELGVARSAVEVVGGATQRLKTLRIRSDDEAVAGKLARLLA